MLVFMIMAIVGCNRPSRPSLKHQHEDHQSIERYAEEVGQAILNLIEVVPSSLRDSLVYPFYSDNRTIGRKTDQTPTFCAVLAWCSKGWGLEMGKLNQEQLVAVHKILNLALSPGGYQVLVSVLNHQRIIGEMEDIGESATIKNAIKAHPEDHAHSIFDYQQEIPDSLFYPALAGAGRPSPEGVKVNWVWDPLSGVKGRWGQFQRYTFAIFGLPGEDAWGIRFEGHHTTVNLSFIRDPKTGQLSVHTTPLFFGTFPMIIPASPYPKQDPDPQWNWEKGQLMMYHVAHHLHRFWLEMPEDLREQALIPPTFFPQSAPLTLDTPIPSLISALDTKVDPSTIRTYPHIEVTTDELSEQAIWHLKQVYLFYTRSMNPNISHLYEKRVEEALVAGKSVVLSWAGSDLEEVGNRHYSYLIVGSLLLEFLQSNQFLVQHNPKVTGNHLHSMLRDVRYDWVDPMHEHHQHDHLIQE